jgi:hypothetical protein
MIVFSRQFRLKGSVFGGARCMSFASRGATDGSGETGTKGMAYGTPMVPAPDTSRSACPRSVAAFEHDETQEDQHHEAMVFHVRPPLLVEIEVG